ncbi:tRNA (guanine N(7)) methyltransferase [Trichuris trichiura]|uniref:tRNA (guanine-N(7)-)-methyltransferase n=1 Tax=Trichuris trichiura TaxID=36087 RepID=A0A077Z0P0_TRITR|nr:tRNA (guanine N(7)) methyltransferase [Trichuris trichiura]
MESSVLLPQKKHYRQRAHSNPMSDHVLDFPARPDDFDVRSLYVKFFETHDSEARIEILDVGCGYGGLLVALSPLYPDSLIVGMEIRCKVSDYVKQRIAVLRTRNQVYSNIACIRTNAMKVLPHYFFKGQLKKMFFLFPDPHFKKSKHKWRIISRHLLAEYAYVLAIGGVIYVATDVSEYIDWARALFNEHPLFCSIPDEQLTSDPLRDIILNSTEEGQKVTRNKGNKFLAAFKRVEDPFGNEPTEDK